MKITSNLLALSNRAGVPLYAAVGLVECLWDSLTSAQDVSEALDPPVMPDEEGYTDVADDELPF